jgi:flagellar biosynthesis GTPase FlhF
VLIIVLACYVTYKIWKRRKVEKENYHRQVVLLERTQSEVIKLRTHEADLKALIQEKEQAFNQQETGWAELEELRQHTSELSKMIQEKEAVAEQQRQELTRYQHKETITQESVEGLLNESDVMGLLNEKSNKGQQLTEEEWRQIHQLVIKVLPGFYQFISTNKHALNQNEYRTCILTRLHIKPSCISSLLDVSPSYISKIRPRLVETLFGVEGTGKDFDARILEIS